MSIVVLNLPAVKHKTEERPQKCPYCEGETFQRWGQVNKALKDTRVRQVKVYRYRCCHCQHTFRHYPEGVSPAQQSERLMKLCVIMWSLGLSHRSVVLILSVFGVSLCHMSSWRDTQAAGQRIRRRLTVETSTDRGCGWSLGQWQGHHGGSRSGRRRVIGIGRNR